jgi:hypothetical protein
MFERKSPVMMGFVLMMAFAVGAVHAQDAGLTVTEVITRIATGSFDGGVTRYRTAFIITNLHSGPLTISANFYNQNGSPICTAILTIKAVSHS